MESRFESAILPGLLVSLLLCADLASGTVCLDPVCEYDFTVGRTQTMTYVHPSGTTFNVALNGSKLIVIGNKLRTTEAYPDIIGMTVDPDHVITADGYPRDITVINDQFPGPTIEVMEGSQVVVRVHNNLLNEITSFHWHGMRMRSNYYMDGVPYITQCPILPRQTFTYRFQADPPGTHWYHSHQANQRIDGLYGMLIVHRKSADPLPSHNVFVTDWAHFTSDALAARSGTTQYKRFTGETLRNLHSRFYSLDGVELTTMDYVSSLFGGRGRYKNEPFPLAVYPLTSGHKHVFRLVSAAADFSYEISADGHVIDVTALDGYEIQPIRVDSVIIHPGETIDMVIPANQPVSRYWIRAKTLLAGIGLDLEKEETEQEVRAILEYDGSSDGATDPKSEPELCTKSRPCVVFNCPFQDYPPGYNKSCRHVTDACTKFSPSMLDQEYGLSEASPEEIFLNFAFIGGSSVNGRKFMQPRGFGNLDSESGVRHSVRCDEDACTKRGCSCTNVISLPFNVTIQMVVMNYQPILDYKNLPSHHSVHIHGHGFTVLATGFGTSNNNVSSDVTKNVRRLEPNSDISCDNNVCSRPRWTGVVPPLNRINPPVRDTVLVPAQGYVVIRFRTDNPGRWIMHCHQELHFLKGMALLIDEAVEHHPRPPNGFPSCGDFHWSEATYRKYMESNKMTSIDERNATSQTPVAVTDDIKGTDTLIISPAMAVIVAVALVLLGAVLSTIPLILIMKRNQYNKSKRKRPLRPQPEAMCLLNRKPPPT